MILNYLTNCKVLSTVSQEADEETWLANRSKGIGGSEVGAICGVNKYSSPRLVYLKKTGQYDPEFSDASRERMYWGHVLEPVVASEFERRTGKKVVVSPATLQHKDHPWALANIDRFIVDDNGVPYGILECKTADSRMLDDWAEGDVPVSYIYQLTWYLLITGLKYGAFACLVGGNKFFYYEVYFNDDLAEEIFQKANHFWNYNVKNAIEPDLIGNDADTEFVKEQHPDVDKNAEITLQDDEYNELAERIFHGKVKIKELEAEIDEAANRLKEKMGRNEIAYTTDHTIKWSARTANRVDTERLKVEFPDIYKKVIKASSYRVFTIK